MQAFSDRLVADRRARKRHCSSSLVGVNKTCSEFLGPGMIVNQDETSEESKIKENLCTFDETALCFVQGGLTIQAQSSVQWILFFFPFGALRIQTDCLSDACIS